MTTDHLDRSEIAMRCLAAFFFAFAIVGIALMLQGMTGPFSPFALASIGALTLLVSGGFAAGRHDYTIRGVAGYVLVIGAQVMKSSLGGPGAEPWTASGWSWAVVVLCAVGGLGMWAVAALSLARTFKKF